MTPLLPAPNVSRWLQAAIVLLPCAAFFVADAPYLHDFAEWLYQSQILVNLLTQPETVQDFAVIRYPVPNSLATVIMAALGLVMPGLWAGKTFLVLLLLAWLWVIRGFVRRYVDRPLQEAATLVLFATAALATFFWYGFVSYQLALLLFTGFLCRDDEQIKASTVALFSLAIFFAHALIFLAFGAYICVRILVQRRLSYILALIPSTLLSLWYIAGRQVTGFVAPVADAQWAGLGEALLYKAGYPAMLGPFKNFLRPDGSSLFESQPWVYWLGFVTNFAVALAIGLFVIAVLWQNRERILRMQVMAHGVQPAVALTVFGFALAYLLAPYPFFGLFNPGGRLLLPLLLMCFIIGKQEAARLTRLVFWPVALVTVLTCGSYLYLVSEARGTDVAGQAAPPAAGSPTESVFAFNRALYAGTRYTYFNYRVFAFAGQFDRIEAKEYDVLLFGQGLLTRRPAATPDRPPDPD